MEFASRGWKAVALGALAALAGGCGTSSVSVDDRIAQLQLDGAFVAVPRAVTAAKTQALDSAVSNNTLPKGVIDANNTFYLAIHKNQLGKKWFMSAYLNQLFPRVAPGQQTLGTRVVSFKVQNDKLFVFDVDDRKKTSDSANPEVIVEAYPIIEPSSAFKSLPRSGNYVIFDPSAGLNRFTAVGDAFSGYSSGSRFQVDLMFSQRFRSIADGITFDQVFTGASEEPVHEDPVENSAFRFSGTIGVALRQYTEGQGFTQVALPESEHYFRSMVRIVPEESRSEQVAAHWNIHPGMKPIRWVISRSLLKLAQHPDYAQYDLVAAVRAGVENWNSVFGFTALEAVIAEEGSSPGDDDTNYLEVDLDTNFGFARANWRTNPNTGEIRGASVYFSALWVAMGHEYFEDDAVAPTSRPRPPGLTARPVVPSISWNALGGAELCATHPADAFDANAEPFAADAAADGPGTLTKKQKVENYITHTLLHEVGHTLGLRHNFKGSLQPLSSSVMEYMLDEDAYRFSQPGPYDIAAIRYLYGLSTELPSQPFCTDDSTVVDPMCARFDATDDPLNKYYGKIYLDLVGALLSGKAAAFPNVTLNNVLPFLRAGADSATRMRAFAIVTTGSAVPVDPAIAASPQLAARADALARNLFNRLYLDAEALRGTYKKDPPTNDAALNAAVLEQLKGILKNSDGIRSYASRRVAVDVLKKLQTLAAYQSLSEARAVITEQKSQLSGNELLMTEDLLARVTNAVSPYFVK